ncbi:unnamed protein product, partial [Trichogramma brassicae]
KLWMCQNLDTASNFGHLQHYSKNHLIRFTLCVYVIITYQRAKLESIDDQISHHLRDRVAKVLHTNSA